MGNVTHDKTRNTTTRTRNAAMLVVVAALATGLAVGTPSAALAAGKEDASTEVVAGAAGTDAGEAGTDGTRSTGGEDAAGEGSDGKPRPAVFSPADAAILAVVAVAMAAAVRSVAKRGTKTCGCGCGACGGSCGKAKPSPARRLEDDEELQARLRELKTRSES